MSIISKKLQNITPSPTLAVSALARQLTQEGKDVISLSVGEPDFETPDNVKQAGIAAITRGDTRYTMPSGTLDLRKAVCDKFQRDNDLHYSTDEIIVSNGGKQVIFNLLMATINAGDEVLIPAPYWVSYPDMVKLTQGVPIVINTSIENNFKLTALDLENAITSKTKWLILNSPSNPTGNIYNKDELLQIAEILRKNHHLYVMSDDIYEHITFDNNKFHTLASLAPDLKDRIFIINGVSKAYSMTGWRIGFGAGHKDIIKAMTTIQSQSNSSPCSISQAAALEALTGPQDYLQENTKNLQIKRDYVLQELNKMPGIMCTNSDGAFYLFPKCKELFGKTTPDGHVINSSIDLGKYLIETKYIAIVPGVGFGMEGYFRLSFAKSMKDLKEACHRMKEAFELLS